MEKFAPAEFERELVGQLKFWQLLEQIGDRDEAVSDVRRQPRDLPVQVVTGFAVRGDVDGSWTV